MLPCILDRLLRLLLRLASLPAHDGVQPDGGGAGSPPSAFCWMAGGAGGPLEAVLESPLSAAVAGLSPACTSVAGAGGGGGADGGDGDEYD